ncbi:MAG TPA: hypothetical protein VK712_00900 [Verrucomicrobiae bacterium]|nr:hypothetical protein [Verrucomicrobiae bacterium]
MRRDPIIEGVSKLPFVGRHSVRPHYLSGLEGARNGNYLKRAGAMAFMGFMAVMHGYQAKLGIDALMHNSHGGGVSYS